MALTPSTLDDLLSGRAVPHGWLHLPPGTDPHTLVTSLTGRYGVPRTLVLDGFADPTTDEERGAALLALLDGRGVTVRAWAHGDRWIGAGTAKDAEGEVRPVLATVPRQERAPLAVVPGECVDWVERLIGITGWSAPPRRPGIDWATTETRLGTRLPADYKHMVETFGEGAFDAFLSLNQEPWTDLGEDGLLAWAGTEHKNRYCWRPDGEDPDRLDRHGPDVRRRGRRIRLFGSGVRLPCPRRSAPPVHDGPVLRHPLVLELPPGRVARAHRRRSRKASGDRTPPGRDHRAEPYPARTDQSFRTR